MDTKQLQKLRADAKFRNDRHYKVQIKVKDGPTFTIDDRLRSNWERQLQAQRREYVVTEVPTETKCPVCKCELEMGFTGYSEEVICPECGWSLPVT